MQYDFAIVARRASALNKINSGALLAPDANKRLNFECDQQILKLRAVFFPNKK
jgi:hypothetical protein